MCTTALLWPHQPSSAFLDLTQFAAQTRSSTFYILLRLVELVKIAMAVPDAEYDTKMAAPAQEQDRDKEGDEKGKGMVLGKGEGKKGEEKGENKGKGKKGEEKGKGGGKGGEEKGENKGKGASSDDEPVILGGRPGSEFDVEESSLELEENGFP